MNEATLLEKRLILALVIVLMTGLMLWNHLLQSDGFERIVIWVYGIFVAGKVAGDWIPSYYVARTASAPAEKLRAD